MFIPILIAAGVFTLAHRLVMTSVEVESNATLADSVAKFTVASTPGRAFNPFSIDIAHALHDMPVIERSN